MSTTDIQGSSRGVTLKSFGTDEDWAWYESLIAQEPHRDTDFYSPAELRELIEKAAVRAWVAMHGEDRVGWCAVLVRSPHHPLENAVHMLGSIVEKTHRGRGFGYGMVIARMKWFERTWSESPPLTASVLPGNEPSERMLARAGFRPGLMQGPWRTWHRPSPKHLMALVETEASLSTLREQDIYAELAREPTEGGGGLILRGLWPDPAAFHFPVPEVQISPPAEA
jgi:RimJ/RimL family protein N-acetyltransferase